MKHTLPGALSRASLLACASLCGTAPLHAAKTWTGATDANWATATNWLEGELPGTTETAIFDANSTANLGAIALGANRTVKGIALSNPASDVTIVAGSTLFLNGGGINMSSATANFTSNAGVTLQTGGDQSFNVASGRSITLASLTRTTSGGTGNANVGVALNIPSTGGSVKVGTTAIPVLLDGQNNPWITYGSNSFAGTDASGFVVAATPTSWTASIGASFFTAPYVVKADFTQSGNGGVHGIVFDDTTTAYTLTLGGSTTFTGRAVLMTSDCVGGTITGGFLRPNRVASGSGGNAPMNFIQNSLVGDLRISNLSNASSSTTVSLVKSGAGKMILTGGNGYTGGTFINAGTLQVGEGGATGGLGSTSMVVTQPGTALVINVSADLALNAPFSGSGSFTQQGSGTTTLGGANSSYTGAIAINGGAIAATTSANLGTGTTLGINGGKLKFLGAFDPTTQTITIGSSGATFDTNGNSLTFANSFASGSTGAVTKDGAGTLTLAAANDYSGGTTVNAGTLLATNTTGSATGSGPVTVQGGAAIGGPGTISGTVTVASGAKVSPGTSVGTVTVGSLDLDAGSTLDIEFGTGNDQINVTDSGGLNIDGGAITLLQEGTANAFAAVGTYNLIAYTGTLGGAATNLTVANPQPGFTYNFGTAGGFVTLTIGTSGAVRDWIVDGSGSWANSANWNGTFPNATGATANFNTVLSAPATVTLDGSKTVGAITFLSGTNGYTIAAGSGGSLIFDNGASGSSILNGDGTHTISAPVTLTTDTVINTAAIDDSITLSDVISGGGDLEKTGPGSLSLLGSNTFTGLLTVSGGTVNFANGGLGAGNLLLSGSKLVWEPGNSQDISNRTITLADNVTLDIGSNDVTLADPIGNSGLADVVKEGEGKLTLNGDATFTGTTTISAGTLQLGSGGATGSVPGDIVNNGGLIVNHSGAFAIPGTISGTGTFAHNGNGTLDLQAANTFSGQTTIGHASGVLNLFSPQGLQGSTLNYSSSGGTLSFDINTTATLGAIEGDKSLALTNTLAGGVALTVGGNNATTTYTGVFSGDGSFTKTGTGEMTLTAAQTYTGSTTVSGGGILTLPSGATINGADLTVTGTASQMHLTGGGLIAPTGNLGVGSGGLFIESGTASFSGLVSAVGSTGSTNSAPIRVYDGALTAQSITLGRGGLNTSAEPTAAPADTNLYVGGGSVNVSGDLLVGTASNQPNSSVVTRVDGGVLTVGGAISVGLNNGGRWSYVDVNGGDLVSTGTGANAGLVLGGPWEGKAALLVRGGTATVERIQFGRDAINGQGLVNVSGGTLYVGSEGVVLGSTGTYTSEVRLSGGTLGAKAAWGTSLPVSITASSIVKAADASDTAHDITLSGSVTGGGSLIKEGGGTLTLSGTYSYGGDTDVTAGTLSLGTGTLSDTGTVNVSSGATLNLNFAGNDTVAGFSIDGVPQADGTWGAIGSGAQHESSSITGTGLLVVPPSDPFIGWIAGYAVGAQTAKSDDPDGDGLTNLDEFALDGDPASGVASGKVRARIETVGADQALVITLPVRDGATFSGTTSQTATIDGIDYTVEGSNDLSLFDQGVTEITASTTGMPTVNTGWTYHTFRLNGAIGGATPRGPKGFLRATVAEDTP